MNSIVMKFGGTSVEGATAFQNAARIVARRIEQRPVVVVSAMARFTDALLNSVVESLNGNHVIALKLLDKHFDRHHRVIDALLSKEANDVRAIVDAARTDVARLLESSGDIKNDRTRRKALTDAVAANGEQLSAALLAAVLVENGFAAQVVDSRQCIITDDEFGCAAPLMPETVAATQARLVPLLDASMIPVMGGFIGCTKSGETTTLGRGGSDFSAALIGAALHCEEIQIWTDVPGVLTADPRIAPKARTVPRLSFAEASELAYFGARVLHPKTLHPAVERDIPVRICNSRAPEGRSTVVVAESETSPQTVKAIAHKTGVTTVQITSARMLGAYGFLRAIFEIFDKYRIAVDVVTTSEVSVSLSLDDTTELPAVVEELEKLGSVSIEAERAILCIVGEGLRSTPGIAARIFSTISDINVSLISQGASRINLTFAVEEARAREAVMRLHQEFFEHSSEEHIDVDEWGVPVPTEISHVANR